MSGLLCLYSSDEPFVLYGGESKDRRSGEYRAE